MLLLMAFAAISCGEKDDPQQPDPTPCDPITLTYNHDSFYSVDNESKRIKMVLMRTKIIFIHGGDGKYKVSNHSADKIRFYQTDSMISVNAKAIGAGSLTISDGSGNEYNLDIEVVGEGADRARVYTYPYIIAKEMDRQRKAQLQQRIIDDAPCGEWTFNTEINEQVRYFARRYMTDDENGGYKEYEYLNKIPNDYEIKPFWAPSEILWSRLIRSDTEEFILYYCEPFANEEGKWIRGSNYIIDVTDRYIEEYPEIIAAYEAQIGYPQIDFK